MRKIEKEMLAAVCEHRNWSCSNTAVVVDNGCVQVILHGSIIYECKGVKEAFTLAGWDTVTTRSRLRALGVDLTSKRGERYHNGQRIEIDRWYQV